MDDDGVMWSGGSRGVVDEEDVGQGSGNVYVDVVLAFTISFTIATTSVLWSLIGMVWRFTWSRRI